MRRRVLGGTGLALLLAATVLGQADPAKRPAWQRVLAGEEQKAAAVLEAKCQEAETAQRWPDAIAAAEQLRDLRKAKQGADHWETADAEGVIRDLNWFRDATPEKRAKWNRAVALSGRGVQAIGRGQAKAGERLLREALALWAADLPPDNLNVAGLMNNLATALSESGRPAEAEPLYREALALKRAILPPGHPDLAYTLGGLAVVLNELGRGEEAEPLQREALAVLREAVPLGDPEIAQAVNGLAAVLLNRGRAGEAESLFREALAMRRAALPPDHPDIAQSLNNLSVVLLRLGRVGEVESLYREALAVLGRTRSPSDPSLATPLNNLAVALSGLGCGAEAEALHRKALAIRRAALPSNHPEIAASLSNLADVLMDLGRAAEAEPLLVEALSLRRAALPAGHPDIALTLNNLAAVRRESGRAGEAEPLLREALAIARAALPPGHPGLANALNSMAVTLSDLARPGEAEPLFSEAIGAAEVARLGYGAGGAGRAEAASGRVAAPALHLAILRARLGRAAAAWEAAESQFARGLLDDLAPAGLTADERAEVARLTAKLPAVQKTLVALATVAEPSAAERARLDQVRAEARGLEARLGEIAARESTRRVAPLDRVRASLRPGEALVFWADAGDRFGCVLRHTGEPVWVPLPGRGDGGKWTAGERSLSRRARAALAQPDALGTSALLSELRQRRVDPLLPHLAGVSRLIVIPRASWPACRWRRWGCRSRCATRPRPACSPGRARRTGPSAEPSSRSATPITGRPDLPRFLRSTGRWCRSSCPWRTPTAPACGPAMCSWSMTVSDSPRRPI